MIICQTSVTPNRDYLYGGSGRDTFVLRSAFQDAFMSKYAALKTDIMMDYWGFLDRIQYS